MSLHLEVELSNGHQRLPLGAIYSTPGYMYVLDGRMHERQLRFRPSQPEELNSTL